MKSKILALAGFFALAACSEDVYQDIDKHNEVLEQSGVGSDDSGNIAPFTFVPGPGGYESPWMFGSAISLNYWSFSDLSNYGFYLRVTPYIGLAYYDGADDGTYVTPTGSYNLAAGGYPNLYSSGSEYGNYIAAAPYVINGQWTTGASTQELSVQGGGHCPVMAATTWTFNPHGIFFDVQNNNVILPTTVTPLPGVVVPPVPSATTPEAALLRDYGKIMYYKIEFGHDPVIFTETVYAICLQVTNFSDPSWDVTTLIATDFLGGELYHNIVSREIVVDAPQLYSTNSNVQRPGMPFFPPGFGQREINNWYDTAKGEVWLRID